MTKGKPTSFKIFLAVVLITTLVFVSATFFYIYQIDKKYTMLLAFFMFVAFAFTTVGIYTGLKYRTEDKSAKTFNRIGLIGNILIFTFTIGLMLFSALSTSLN